MKEPKHVITSFYLFGSVCFLQDREITYVESETVMLLHHIAIITLVNFFLH